MTEQMAIEWVKKQKVFVNTPEADAQIIVIRALKELEQYRAIGTVEEIIAGLNDGVRTLEQSGVVIEAYMSKLEEYQSLGTVEELQALKEKSVAKKPLFIKRSVTQFYACPHCSTNEHYQWIYPKVKHCSECGGLLDWE